MPTPQFRHGNCDFFYFIPLNFIFFYKKIKIFPMRSHFFWWGDSFFVGKMKFFWKKVVDGQKFSEVSKKIFGNEEKVESNDENISEK